MAYVIGAFFMLFFAQADAAGRDCSSLLVEDSKKAEIAVVDHIYDGDTLRLRDGRKVRLLGVNAPELARAGNAMQAGADAAKRAVLDWLPKDRRVRVVVGLAERDHYGRWLAYVFNDQGESLESDLLAKGLAFTVAIPPDLRHAECYYAIERTARQQRLGVWQGDAWQLLGVDDVIARGRSGYVRITGRVTRVDHARDLWIELDGALVLKVSAQNRRYFSEEQIGTLMGRSVAVRGWLVRRSLSVGAQAKGFTPWLMEIHSEYDFESGFVDKK